ncbi:GPW/gp25 family protein [Photobacterium atrarenae]|uniref:GPW/gp25 family protein n=1 Tax=Photobacterium atrarenae TaxID=865757 RepID=A0ABY5GCR1_9GAMM|nr:GPW/gp25 family protein [Photobacterium atrarenae]UTV26382.1 GPW/gp25 family protein [Photobacterium atrarenae]
MRGMDASTGRALSGIDHLKQSVRDILTTPIGSRVMRRDYGSRLFELIDNPGNPETVADIVAESAQALRKWEKRIDVTRVLVTAAQPGLIVLAIEGKYRPNGQPITLEGIEVR